MALADAPLLAALQYLGVSRTEPGTEGLLRLLTSPRLGALEILDIRGTPVGPEVIRAMAHAPALGALEEMDFSDNELGPDAVGDDDVELLLRSSALPSLRKIVLLPPRIWGSAGEVDVVAWRQQLGLR